MWRRRNSDESADTQRARRKAEAAAEELAEVQEQWEQVDSLAAAIKASLRRNHFGEQIQEAMRLRRAT